MMRYIVRRLITNVPVLFLITVIVFLLINLAPGDPLLAMMDPEAGSSPAAVAFRRQQLGLDQPLPVRYGIWIGQLMRGNFGRSYTSNQPVLSEIGVRVLPTLELMGTALILSAILGISLGIMSALRRYSATDYIFTTLGLVWVSMPGFFFAMLMIYLVAVRLDLLPTSGLATPGAPFSFADNLHHLLLPMLALGLERTAVLMRYSRSSMLDVLGQEYMNTARAKGLHERAVILGHGFRNALLPVITILGLNLPVLFGGAVVIETVFQWPGMGMLYITAVNQRDYPVVMGLALMSAIVVLLSNLLADVAYAVVDPRIRYA